MEKHTRLRTNIINVFFFLLLSSIIYKFIKNVVTGFPKHHPGISEFLINYQGGFVRRGLLGEMLLQMHHYTGLSPYYAILILCALAYFVLVAFFLKNSVKQSYPIFFLPFVFFLGNPVINGFWVRKDTLLILIFIAVIYFATRKKNANLILVNLFLSLGLLIHETIGFYCIPVVLLILISKENNSAFGGNFAFKSLLISVSKLMPSLIVFLIVLQYHGSKDIAQTIWSSWEPIDFPNQKEKITALPIVFKGLSWTFKQGLTFSFAYFTKLQEGIYTPLVWFIILIMVYYIMTNTDKLNFRILNYQPRNNYHKTLISNILIFQILSFIPVFILGCDYGRWIFLWVMSSFALYFVVPDKILTTMFPQFISTSGSKINAFLDSLLSKSTGFLVLLCLAIGFPMWNFKLSTFTNAFMMVIQFVSLIMQQAYSVLKIIF